MENASKALIIAGAILLAILIIALGIAVFRQAQETANTDSMNELEVSSFNDKFTQYEGTRVSGSKINSLISAIVQNNISQDDTSGKLITLEITAAATNWQAPTTVADDIPVTSPGKSATGKYYDVECTFDEDTGYVTQITISDN